MKPDYKNRVPKGMIFSLAAGTVLTLTGLIVVGGFGLVRRHAHSAALLPCGRPFHDADKIKSRA